jgi:hypothetical protein
VPPKALTLRLVRPDRQCARLIALFEGSRAPHPAAALAAWKCAGRGRHSLGKPLEAALALFNPEMVREFRVLDEAELAVGFEPGDGRVRWRVTAPHDDGTFAALATALALTGGGSDPPLGDMAVDRLGPPGAPVMARSPEVLALAGSRAALAEALGQAGRAEPVGRPTLDSGWLVRLDPAALGLSGPVWRRRAAEALRAVGCQAVEAAAGLSDETIALAITARLRAAPPRSQTLTVDPDWLGWVPAGAALAAAAWAVDPAAESWDALFALADRVDRVDPARAGVTPLRTRLNVLAGAAGARPERDLWPWLRGLTGCVLADARGELGGVLLAVHARDTEAGARIAGRLLPRVAAGWSQGAEPAPRGDGVHHLGQVAGRPITLARRGATVLVGWGATALAAGLDAHAHPDRSAGGAIRAGWGPTPPQRAGAFWPGRLGALAPPGSPLAQALAQAPPILWEGRFEDGRAREIVRWSGLRGMVRRFLEALPLEPPSDR